MQHFASIFSSGCQGNCDLVQCQRQQGSQVIDEEAMAGQGPPVRACLSPASLSRPAGLGSAAEPWISRPPGFETEGKELQESSQALRGERGPPSDGVLRPADSTAWAAGQGC